MNDNINMDSTVARPIKLVVYYLDLYSWDSEDRREAPTMGKQLISFTETSNGRFDCN